MSGTTARSTTGGDWKELVRAATDGDLALIKYHLDTGIDPNFQHPEFMTTPLLEAVKFHKTKAVEVLLDYHKSNRANPTIVGDWEGTTPLEEAVNGKFHDIVDVLLRALPKDYDASGKFLTIWMTITTTMAVTHHHRDLIAHLLDAGHAVVLVVTKAMTPVMEGDPSSSEEPSLVESLRTKTGNRKFWMISSSSEQKDFFQAAAAGAASNNKTGTPYGNEWRPSTIDVWLHHVAPLDSNDSNEVVTDFASQLNSYRAVVPFRGVTPKVVFLVDSKSLAAGGQRPQQLTWLLNRCSSSSSSNDSDNNKLVHPASCCAILEPTSWWDTVTYSFWNRTWHESVTKLLASMVAEQREEVGGGGTDWENSGDGCVEGMVFGYDGQRLSIMSTEEDGITESSIYVKWEKEFDTIVGCKKSNIPSSL